MSENPLHKTTGRTLRERQLASSDYEAAGTIDAGSFESEMPSFDEAAAAGYHHVSPLLSETPRMQIDMLQVSLTENHDRVYCVMLKSQGSRMLVA